MQNQSKKTEKRRPVTGAFVLAYFSYTPQAFTILQSIPCSILIKFDATSRKLLHTFGFNKLTPYEVTIPGSDSQIQWKEATSLPNIPTNFKLYSCTGTVFF